MEFMWELRMALDVNVNVRNFSLMFLLECETRIAMKYDHKTRSVSFYKNGIHQGVAFQAIQSGLVPALDIWFESGTIEIMKNNSLEEKIYL